MASRDIHSSVAGSSPPWGALAPDRFAELVRSIAHAAPDNSFFRKTSSLLLGPAGGRAQGAVDVIVFDGMKARLHPHDNICEKRVYLTPQHWDPVERDLLAAFIAGDAGPFTFVDVGANAGLYSLFATGVARRAGRAMTIVAVEPDPEMCARMAFNFAASGVSADIIPQAAAAAPGTLRLKVNQGSRGESRISDAGEIEIAGAPLAAILAERGVSVVDAMKVDIEGYEFPTLEAFFRDAKPANWPRFLILEVSHEDPAHSAGQLVLDNGYRVIHANRLNVVFRRD